MLRRLIGSAAIWAGRRRGAAAVERERAAPQFVDVSIDTSPADDVDPIVISFDEFSHLVTLFHAARDRRGLDRSGADVRAEQLGASIPVTAVTGVISCGIADGGVGNTTTRPCRSKSDDSWRGRMDDNDSVKEV